MSIKTYLKRALRVIDLFPNNNLFRYKGEPEYTTITGGVASLLILTVFVILFASMGLKTINKQIISSSQSVQYESNPSKLSVKFGP